jgi:NAD(P)H-hydrate epimerase
MVVTHREMKIIDINSAYLGVPTEVLMGNAGKAVAEAIAERIDVKGKKVVILCGVGNNGGDGLAAAGFLADKGAEVSVYLAGQKVKTPEAEKYYEQVKKDKRINILKDYKVEADIIVDALLGTGVKGELREPVKSIVKEINASKAFKVSIDVPSGLDADTGRGECVRADLVVALHKEKRGLERFKTIVKDIGIPKEAETHVGPGDVVVNLGERRADAHKGEYGRVLVVGGSDLYYGAPILSALAALNCGADLVYLAVPEINYNITKVYSPDLIVRKYEGEYLTSSAIKVIAELAESCNSVVIGPGLGSREETVEAVLELLKAIRIPTVIDADAIKALSSHTKILKNIQVVLTPHSGEFKRLTGEELPGDLEDRKKLVSKWAEKLSSVILLKAPVDIIASVDRVKFNSSGNPGMTVGGTGDVLSGIVGGFIAQGMGLFDAACCGAFVNGFAGDELYKWKGYAFTASDLAAEIPYSIKKIFELALPTD